MIKDNEQLPEIEKLGRHEFDLDIEEQIRLQAQCDAEIEKVSMTVEMVISIICLLCSQWSYFQY